MINRIKHSHCQAVIKNTPDATQLEFNFPIPLFQNYLNESLKFLDKAYPNGGGQGSTPGGGPGGNLTPNSNLHVAVTTPPASSSSTAASPVSSLMMHQDTKPIYIDSKALLGHHMHHLADKK